MSLRVRPPVETDAEPLCVVINAIIAAGGTTANETPFTPARLWEYSLGGPGVLCCHVVTLDSEPVGFQGLYRSPDLPEGWGDIGSFTRQVPRVPGAGTALFAATLARARALGLVAMNATIRADNVPGLAYYTKMGFVEYDVGRAVPLADGTPVDRIKHKRAV